MIFNTGTSYFPMDREYSKKTENELGFGVKDVGMSVPLGIAAGNVSGVAAKIRSGAGNLEIAFPGAVRGQRQQQTPGMYGEDTRTALKELAQITEVNLSTHAAYGIMGLAGFTGDYQGNFNKEHRKVSVDEIKRAIEFARDTAQGGSVVVHTGEVERPISEEPWAKDSEGNFLFKQYPTEPDRAMMRIVDRRSGQVVHQVRKNHKLGRFF